MLLPEFFVSEATDEFDLCLGNHETMKFCANIRKKSMLKPCLKKQSLLLHDTIEASFSRFLTQTTSTMKKILFFSLIVFAGLIATATQTGKKRSKMKMPDGFVFIPQGMITIDSIEYKIDAFMMAKHEVTNKQYRDFLNDLKAGNNDDAIAMIDTSVWDFPNSYCEPLKVHYFSHPAYDNYPVVGVSYEGAVLYCNWLTQKTKADGHDIQFYLPSRAQWIYAASGGMRHTVYPWPGPYLTDMKRMCKLCNYASIGDERISKNPSDETFRIEGGSRNPDGVLITSIVGSYPKNSFGLYDMSGNVAEMTSEKGLACGGSWNSPGYDVRIFSTSNYNKADAFTGFRPMAVFSSR